ncbi:MULTISPECIES: type I-C CRISPR-associated protein Cas8c/Csd1 [Streptomyces]|uniref:type I-C CRISPR-associated protein Cas8c/Csd1 n=1 Tax=Streptomyces TaxID=1883 RepID=UPI00224962C4|nr:type I-C CRISPR-associated protein Cas8c/Csd1 [Streptomyces sp. JHD 1]MCX2968995.1 type I-C CRISPR-associated protein Cas8c/Csd1 [Streptomyces sp. JHD 1]
MLLQRLNEFAARAAEELPAEYYRSKTVHWVLRIAEDGRSAELQGDGPLPAKQRDQAVVEQVPHVQRSGTKVPPYLLVDTAEFVLGVPRSGEGSAGEKLAVEAERRHRAWRALALAWAGSAPEDGTASALRVYLTDPVVRPAAVGPRVEAKDLVAVRVGRRWLHTLPSVQRYWAEEVRRRKGGRTERSGLCLVCGKRASLLATIPEPVKKGAVPTAGGSNEGQLISINAAAQGRRGITQLANTPICHSCGGRAMAALNHLLASDRHSRRFRENGVLVWWTRVGSADDDLRAVVQDELDETLVGRMVDSLNDRPTPLATRGVDTDVFYGLTLGLNNARVVVRDWIDVPVREVTTHLGRWFAQHGVFDGWEGRVRWVPVWLMALSCGRWNGDRYAKDSAPRDLEHALLRSALGGSPVPARVLPTLLQRIQADQRIDTPRVALLRLVLNRNHHERNAVDPAMPERLDETSDDPAYTAGRMFFVLEETQRLALHNLNTSLRDKHFRTAMIAPRTTMTQLAANSVAHFRRLSRDNPAAGTALLNRLSELQARLTNTLPQHLTPEGQARFVLGYFHQRHSSGQAARKQRETGKASPPDDEATVTAAQA